MDVESLLEQVPEAVGRRVRDARAARGLTLDQLADRSGVSRRMIVNVESGTSNASIATLLRLAGGLTMSLADLVADTPADSRLVVVTAAQREPLWAGPEGGSATLVASADTPDMLELWEWALQPGESYASEAHRPGTRELILVASGTLDLTVGDETRRLRAGDSASIVTDTAHSYANDGGRPVRFTMTVFEPLPRVRP